MNHCIALGDGAQANDCDYQFSISTNGGQYSTVMTPEEYEVVNRVVRRAIEGGFKLRGNNEMIGYQAGAKVTPGKNNVWIGDWVASSGIGPKPE